MQMRAGVAKKTIRSIRQQAFEATHLFDSHPESSLDFEKVRAAVKDGYSKPFLLIDSTIVREKTRRFTAAMPRVRPHYAIKANPDPRILKLMLDQGGRPALPAGRHPQYRQRLAPRRQVRRPRLRGARHRRCCGETQGRPRGRRLPRGLAVPQSRELARRHRKVARGFRPDAKSRTQSATSEHRRGFPSEARQADPRDRGDRRGRQPGAGRVSRCSEGDRRAGAVPGLRRRLFRLPHHGDGDPREQALDASGRRAFRRHHRDRRRAQVQGPHRPLRTGHSLERCRPHLRFDRRGDARRTAPFRSAGGGLYLPQERRRLHHGLSEQLQRLPPARDPRDLTPGARSKGGPRAPGSGRRPLEQHALGGGLRGAVDTSLSQASILIVDDDSRSLLALQELLQSVTQKVVLARSGEEALRCVLKEDFAAILLDARMPGVDGFETARLIRERERSRHTPIIFLTGAYEDVHSVFRGYEAGAVDYIVKPLVPEILKSKISVFVELYNKKAVLIREIAERKQVEE